MSNSTGPIPPSLAPIRAEPRDAGGLPPRGTGHPAIPPPLSPLSQSRFDLVESLLRESSSPSAFAAAAGSGLALGNGHGQPANLALGVPQVAPASALRPSHHAAAVSAAMYGTASPAGMHDPGGAAGPNPNAFVRMMSMDPPDDDVVAATGGTNAWQTRPPRSTTWPTETSLTRAPYTTNRSYTAALVRADPNPALGVPGVLAAARGTHSRSNPYDDVRHGFGPAPPPHVVLGDGPGVSTPCAARGVGAVDISYITSLMPQLMPPKTTPSAGGYFDLNAFIRTMSLDPSDDDAAAAAAPRSAKLEEVEATPDGIRGRLRDNRAKTEPKEESLAKTAARQWQWQ